MIQVNLQGLNKETKTFSSKKFFSLSQKLDPKVLDYSLRVIFDRTKVKDVVEGYGHDLDVHFFKKFCEDYEKENKQMGNSLKSVERGQIKGVFCLKNK